MRIVILGAGQVGASVAEALASEANDITIVDQSREAIGDIANRLDVRTLVGNGALPSVLKNAGLDDADMLVAVTQSDSTNLVACKIARSVFNVTTRIARLRSADYLDDQALLDDEHFAVTHAICPEQEITDYIVRLIEFPEALQVLRVMQRSGLEESQVRAIMAAQVGRAERLAAADDILDNGGTIDALREQVAGLHRRYLALAATAKGL